MKGHKNYEEEKDVKAVTNNARREKTVRGSTQKETDSQKKLQKAAAQQEAGVQSSSEQAEGKSVWHHEDLALKTAARYFGEELMPLLGIKGKAEYIAPTEIVKLEARDMYQDFNYAMKEKCWVHLEFESDEITREDLKRFREYEAAVSRTYKTDVITYVICSSSVKKLRCELNTGINVYRVRIIRLKGQDADLLLEAAEEKRKRGETLTKTELAPLLLTPLMSGKLNLKERIIKSLKILQASQEGISSLEMEKMQAVLYTFADKFLTGDELNNVKEVIVMTKLGQMIFNDGIEEGIEKGIEKGIHALILDNLEEGVRDERILEKLQKRFSLTRTEAAEKLREYKTQL